MDVTLSSSKNTKVVLKCGTHLQGKCSEVRPTNLVEGPVWDGNRRYDNLILVDGNMVWFIDPREIAAVAQW